MLVVVVNRRAGHSRARDQYGHLLEVVHEQLLAALDVGLTAGR